MAKQYPCPEVSCNLLSPTAAVLCGYSPNFSMNTTGSCIISALAHLYCCMHYCIYMKCITSTRFTIFQ